MLGAHLESDLVRLGLTKPILVYANSLSVNNSGQLTPGKAVQR